jgi:glycosyltransferase involved in cell wall biosynthesis
MSMDPPATRARPEPGISFIVPALDEESTLAAAVARCRAAALRHFPAYEIIIVDDGSTDATGAVAEGCATMDPNVRVVHHDRPRNLGFAYKVGVGLARFEHVLMFPGDDEGSDEQLDAVLSRAGAADVVINYIANAEVRGWRRRAVSAAFVGVMNRLFGLGLRYYNGTVLHRTELVRSIPIRTDSFAYQAEALVRVLRAGRRCEEVATAIRPRTGGRSKAFRLRNCMEVALALVRLAWEVHWAQGAAAVARALGGRSVTPGAFRLPTIRSRRTRS